MANIGSTEFEAMLSYEDALTWDLLMALGTLLKKPQDAILEDIGIYLVSHPQTEPLRRLLRFGGVDFVDFLHSLDELPDRTRIAVPDLALPEMELVDHASNRYSLTLITPYSGFGHVMMGILRSMADDYGALVILEYSSGNRGVETIDITLVETRFSAGRSFELGMKAGDD